MTDKEITGVMVELTIDIPVDPLHGLTKGRVMRIARMAKPTETPDLFVVGDLAVEVGLVSAEYGLVAE